MKWIIIIVACAVALLFVLGIAKYSLRRRARNKEIEAKKGGKSYKLRGNLEGKDKQETEGKSKEREKDATEKIKLTAMDEIAPLRHPQVQQNQAYLVIVLLSRVVTRLGDLPAIDTGVIESLFAADLAYLQTLYRRINEEGVTTVPVQCPECQAKFRVDLSSLGGE